MTKDTRTSVRAMFSATIFCFYYIDVDSQLCGLLSPGFATIISRIKPCVIEEADELNNAEELNRVLVLFVARHADLFIHSFTICFWTEKSTWNIGLKTISKISGRVHTASRYIKLYWLNSVWSNCFVAVLICSRLIAIRYRQQLEMDNQERVSRY